MEPLRNQASTFNDVSGIDGIGFLQQRSVLKICSLVMSFPFTSLRNKSICALTIIQILHINTLTLLQILFHFQGVKFVLE